MRPSTTTTSVLWLLLLGAPVAAFVAPPPRAAVPSSRTVWWSSAQQDSSPEVAPAVATTTTEEEEEPSAGVAITEEEEEEAPVVEAAAPEVPPVEEEEEEAENAKEPEPVVANEPAVPPAAEATETPVEKPTEKAVKQPVEKAVEQPTEKKAVAATKEEDAPTPKKAVAPKKVVGLSVDPVDALLGKSTTNQNLDTKPWEQPKVESKPTEKEKKEDAAVARFPPSLMSLSGEASPLRTSSLMDPKDVMKDRFSYHDLPTNIVLGSKPVAKPVRAYALPAETKEEPNAAASGRALPTKSVVDTWFARPSPQPYNLRVAPRGPRKQLLLAASNTTTSTTEAEMPPPRFALPPAMHNHIVLRPANAPKALPPVRAAALAAAKKEETTEEETKTTPKKTALVRRPAVADDIEPRERRPLRQLYNIVLTPKQQPAGGALVRAADAAPWKDDGSNRKSVLNTWFAQPMPMQNHIVLKGANPNPKRAVLVSELKAILAQEEEAEKKKD